MSDVAPPGRYAMVPRAAINDHRLTLIELRVLIALHSFKSDSTATTVFPSRETLAERSGYTKATVSRAVSGLIAHGWITIKQHRGPNTYHLLKTAETVTDSDTVADPATVADSDTVADSGINSDRSGHETVTDPATPEETLKRPKEETGRNGVPPCPHEEIIALYHEVLPELQRVVTARWPGTPRARSLQLRWREDARHRDLRFWQWFFEAVRTNPFYLGENDRRWRADLGWLLKRANFDKVIERGIDQRRMATA